MLYLSTTYIKVNVSYLKVMSAHVLVCLTAAPQVTFGSMCVCPLYGHRLLISSSANGGYHTHSIHQRCLHYAGDPGHNEYNVMHSGQVFQWRCVTGISHISGGVWQVFLTSVAGVTGISHISGGVWQVFLTSVAVDDRYFSNQWLCVTGIYHISGGEQRFVATWWSVARIHSQERAPPTTPSSQINGRANWVMTWFHISKYTEPSYVVTIT
jgi:hypothetical protein